MSESTPPPVAFDPSALVRLEQLLVAVGLIEAVRSDDGTGLGLLTASGLSDEHVKAVVAVTDIVRAAQRHAPDVSEQAALEALRRVLTQQVETQRRSLLRDSV